jgi:D-arabinose 5-phosphate isomerase GutQ
MADTRIITMEYTPVSIESGQTCEAYLGSEDFKERGIDVLAMTEPPLIVCGKAATTHVTFKSGKQEFMCDPHVGRYLP